MKRREFIATAAVVAGTTAVSGLHAQEKSGQQIIEWVRYRLNTGARKNSVADFYEKVAIPAMNRAGIDRVGVFSVTYGPTEPSLYVLIPHPDMESVLTLPGRLLSDKTYLADGAEFLNTPLSEPMYVRKESQILQAFKNMPQVESPTDMLDNKGRIYELRTYESHSVKYGNKKVEMFNDGGEIAIFRKTGLRPVFYGQTIIGERMPNLTYMLVHESMEARDANWKQFVSHPDWKALSGDEQYKDTVSNISDYILRPLAFSQI